MAQQPDPNTPLSDEYLIAHAADPEVTPYLTSDERRRLTRLRSSVPTDRAGAFARFVEPIASAPVHAAEFIGTMLTDPKAAGKAVLDPMGAQMDQAAQASREGRPLAAVGHAAASLPIVGPAVASGIDQVRSGDVAGGLGSLTATAAPFLAGSVARGSLAAAKAVPGSARVLNPIADVADRMSTARLTDVISPKVGPNKTRFGGMAEDVAPTLAREPGLNAWSREGLHGKVQTRLGEAEAALDQATDTRLVSQQVKTGPLVQAIDRKIADLTAHPVDGSHVVREVPASEAAARETPTNVTRIYALRWMKDEMESLPFVKRSFNDVPTRHGGAVEVSGGAAGSPIYRAVVGAEGQEVIKATRAQVVTAINDVMAGKTSGRLRELVAGVADDLARGDSKTQRLMATSGPSAEGIPQSEWRSLGTDKPTPPPAMVARPLGQAVEPEPNAAQIETLRKIRAEVAALGPVAPYESVRRIRQAWDTVAKVKFMPSTAQDALKAQGDATAAVKGTGAIRDALAGTDPATAQANATYSLMRSANDVLEATHEAERSRPRVGRGIMARATGAMVGASEGGMTGGVIGAIVGGIADQAAQLAPTLQIAIARRLAAVADALRHGDTATATQITERIVSQFPKVKSTLKISGKLTPTAGRALDVPLAADEQTDQAPGPPK